MARPTTLRRSVRSPVSEASAWGMKRQGLARGPSGQFQSSIGRFVRERGVMHSRSGPTARWTLRTLWEPKGVVRDARSLRREEDPVQRPSDRVLVSRSDGLIRCDGDQQRQSRVAVTSPST